MDPFGSSSFREKSQECTVHIAHSDGEAKFWLTPEVALASHTGLSAQQLREAQRVVVSHLEEIRNEWNRHFGT